MTSQYQNGGSIIAGAVALQYYWQHGSKIAASWHQRHHSRSGSRDVRRGSRSGGTIAEETNDGSITQVAVE